MGNNYLSKNIFLAILLFSLLNSALGLPGISDEEAITGDIKDLRDIAEMEGQWYVFPENIKIGEETMSSKNFSTNFLKKNSRNSLATLSIEKVSKSTIGLYRVHVEILNSIEMDVRMFADLWKTVTSPPSTFIGGPLERLNFENQMSSLIQNPNSVKIVGRNLIIQKDDMMVTFVR